MKKITESRQSLQQLYPTHIEIPILIALTAILLALGLTLPLMKVEKMLFWRNEYSVLTGIIGLFHDREYFLSALLFFFSCIFPVVKIICLWILWQVPSTERVRGQMLKWLGILGKWSMLDVFVVAVLIVAMKLGPVASVSPRVGIYIFSIAIILSISITGWIEKVRQTS